jgi:hypothetical protein
MQEQSFRDLNEDELDWLAAQRDRVEVLFAGNAEALAEYQTDPGKLAVIRAVLNAKAFRPDQTFELQGLGVIFGDVLASQLGMQWRVLEDELGASPCLVLPGTSIVLFPQTMISKRIERGEELEVLDLLNEIVSKVEEILAKGGAG